MRDRPALEPEQQQRLLALGAWHETGPQNRYDIMTTTFRLAANELDQTFLDRVKAMFREKQVAIVVYEENDADYLNGSRVNGAATYRERARALRGAAKGIDTTVERDDDRV